MNVLGEEGTDLGPDRKLLFELPAQRTLVRLSVLDLPARQLPMASSRGRLTAPTGEEPPSATPGRRDNS